MRSSNGAIIATVEACESNASAKNGIESIQKNAADAQIVDVTVSARMTRYAGDSLRQGLTRPIRPLGIRPGTTLSFGLIRNKSKAWYRCSLRCAEGCRGA